MIARTERPPPPGIRMRPTFNPIHLIVPTSRSLNGLKILSTCTFSPVLSPGFKTEVPVNVSTWIASALYEASPTSCDGSHGSPIRGSSSEVVVEVFLGMNRTRPGKCTSRQISVRSSSDKDLPKMRSPSLQPECYSTHGCKKPSRRMIY
jgi:hypothetical protein